MTIQDMINTISDRIVGATTVDTAFGEPRVMNNRAIIPIALVAGGCGAGGGEGKRPNGEGTQEEGSGGGGGGGFAVRPLAVLEVTDQQTRVIPILDVTRIVLAAFGLIGGCMWMHNRMKSREKCHSMRGKCH